ncbi:MAG: N-methylhydantoinase, partial [Solirubrobacteraceae bacterium]|nr:N-methylhydantoinase [Solirubrobacteraceae bacterium]
HKLAAVDGAGAIPQRSSERTVIFASGETTAGVYQRETLAPGHRIEGPAVIESMDCTTLITPNRHAVVDDYGSIVIKEVEGS